MVYIQISGCAIFAISSVILSILLRKYPTEKARKFTTTILHTITVFTFFLPVLIGIFYPGLTSYDTILGIPSFPSRPIIVLCGVILIPMGLFFVFISIFALFEKGCGQPAFILTKKVVDGYVYKLCRNPMSFGFYSGCLALGFLSGSTYFTLWMLIEVIPSHILYLKIFEELELEMRFGQSYIEYKKHTPFLVPDFRKIVIKKSSGCNS